MSGRDSAAIHNLICMSYSKIELENSNGVWCQILPTATRTYPIDSEKWQSFTHLHLWTIRYGLHYIISMQNQTRGFDVYFEFFPASEGTGTLACCCGPDSPSDSIRMFPDRPTDHKVEEETIKGNRVRAREVMVEWWWFTRFIFRLHQRLQSTFLSHLFLCCFAYKIINCSGYRYLVTYNLATYSQ